MIRRAHAYAAPAEGAAYVELSERAALLARLMALDLGVDEGDLIEDLIAARARSLGIAALLGKHVEHDADPANGEGSEE